MVPPVPVAGHAQGLVPPVVDHHHAVGVRFVVGVVWVEPDELPDWLLASHPEPILLNTWRRKMFQIGYFEKYFETSPMSVAPTHQNLFPS